MTTPENPEGLGWPQRKQRPAGLGYPDGGTMDPAAADAGALVERLQHQLAETQQELSAERQRNADYVEAAARSIQRERHLEERMKLDPLTGIANRLHLNSTYLEMQNIPAQRRQDASPSLGNMAIMGDLDNFKLVNDTYGHAAGDEVLQAVAKVLRDRIRPTDTPGRLGGEEFVVLLPNADLEVTGQVATRILDGIRQLVIVVGHKVIRPTMSIGIAPLIAGTDLSKGLSLADAAMYQAKDAGRNRIVVAPPSNFK